MTKSHSDDSPSISPEEFAELFGISRDTVYRWIKQGRLKPVAIGPRVWRFRPSQIEAFINEPQRETQYTHIDEKAGTAWAKKETMR
jgi:excisionase family DNA binding protein